MLYWLSVLTRWELSSVCCVHSSFLLATMVIEWDSYWWDSNEVKWVCDKQKTRICEILTKAKRVQWVSACLLWDTKKLPGIKVETYIKPYCDLTWSEWMSQLYALRNNTSAALSIPKYALRDKNWLLHHLQAVSWPHHSHVVSQWRNALSAKEWNAYAEKPQCESNFWCVWWYAFMFLWQKFCIILHFASSV